MLLLLQTNKQLIVVVATVISEVSASLPAPWPTNVAHILVCIAVSRFVVVLFY